MDLIGIEDVEAALGDSLESGEETQVGYYISLVSAYIESYTNVKFAPEEVTARFKTDYYGTVDLPGPVSSVEDVHYYYGLQAEWRWDGYNQIYDLQPEVAVDVEFVAGYSTVPNDIKMVAIEAVKRLYFSPAGQENGPLLRYRVGDVEEMYKPAFNIGIGGGLFNDLETYILDKYKVTASTLRVGFTQHERGPIFPESDTALSE